MSTVRGGDVKRFVFGGREFAAAVDSEWEYVPGRAGRAENEVQLLPNGEITTTQRLRPVGITSATLSVKPGAGDVEFLHAAAKAAEVQPFVMELANGQSYAGSGVPNGEMIPNSMGQLESSFLGANFEAI